MTSRCRQQLEAGANLLVLQNLDLVAPQRTVRQGPAALAEAGPASLVVVPLLAKASPAGLKSLQGPAKKAMVALADMVVPADLVNLAKASPAGLKSLQGPVKKAMVALANMVVPADLVNLVPLADLVNLVLLTDPASLVVRPSMARARLVSLGSHLGQEGSVLVQQIWDSQMVDVLARSGVLVLIRVSSKIVALPVDIINELLFTACFLDFSWSLPVSANLCHQAYVLTLY